MAARYVLSNTRSCNRFSDHLVMTAGSLYSHLPITTAEENVLQARDQWLMRQRYITRRPEPIPQFNVGLPHCCPTEHHVMSVPSPQPIYGCECVECVAYFSSYLPPPMSYRHSADVTMSNPPPVVVRGLVVVALTHPGYFPETLPWLLLQLLITLFSVCIKRERERAIWQLDWLSPWHSFSTTSS